MMGVRTHVGLLRGVNVGGHNRLAMSELREIVTGLGFSNVVTYIQVATWSSAPSRPGP